MTTDTLPQDLFVVNVGPVELEDAPSFPDHARIDVGGSKGIGGQVGGLVEVRISKRRSLRLTVWTQLAYDLAEATNAAIWRRIERKHEGSTHD